MSFLRGVKCTRTYKYFVKSSRCEVTNKKYISDAKTLNRTGGQTVMFKRAPKHFKLGKQKIQFFHANLRRVSFLSIDGGVLMLSPYVIYNLFSFEALYQNHPTVCLHKVTASIKVLLTLI